MRKKKMLSSLLAAMMAMSMLACAAKEQPTQTTAEVATKEETTKADVEVTTQGATEQPTQPVENTTLDIINLSELVSLRKVTLPQSEALSFVEDMQIGWNLGNTFDATNENAEDELDIESYWCGIKTTREMIQTIAHAGFKTIRIPVSWHNHVDADYNISKAWIERVQEVVDWSLEAGMYVIINIHHDNEPGFMYPSYAQLETSKRYVTKIWQQIAAHFADYDDRLIFETLNEPRQKDTDHEWWVNASSAIGKECIDCINQLNQTAVDAIRSDSSNNNKSRYIMVPGYCASPDFALTGGFVIPDDAMATKENHILISVHAYRPYNFALAGPNEKGSTDKFSLKNKADVNDIDSFMKQLYDKFTSKGIGVVIGEFGARFKKGFYLDDALKNNEARKELAAYYAANARNYGMTAVWWDNNAFTSGEAFGLLKRDENKIFYPEIVAQMIYYSKKE